MRRLVPVAAIVLLGLSACGRVEKTSSGPAAGPRVTVEVPAVTQPGSAPAQNEPRVPAAVPPPSARAKPLSSAEMAADLEKGIVLMSQERWAEALPILQSVAAEDPDFVGQYPGKQWPEVHVATVLGEAYARTRHWADAIPWIARSYAWAMARLPGADSAAPGIIANCREQMLAEGIPTEPLALLDEKRYILPPEIAMRQSSPVVSLKGLCDDTDAALAWGEGGQSVTATLGEKSVTFTLGRSRARVNGRNVGLPVAPYLDGQWGMMVPLRPLVEALGGRVTWESEAQIFYVGISTRAARGR